MLRSFLQFFCLGLLLLASQSMAEPAPTNTSARVLIIENSAALYDLQPVTEQIQLMVDTAITNLTGKPALRAAWLSLVSTNDVIGLKVYSSPGPNSGTRPAVVAAVIQDLITAGVPPRHIIVWDRRTLDLRLAGYFEFEQRFGVRVVGAIEAGYDTNKFYETPLLVTLVWTDVEFGQTGTGIGRKSYLSKLVTQEMTKIINITPMLHHNLVGVTGNLFSLAVGSVDNTSRFENGPDSLARAVPEIYAQPLLGDRVVLNIMDALICQYEGQERGLLHYSTILDQLRFSRDAVALDVLSFNEINRQRQIAEVSNPGTNMDLYSNASLVEIGISDPKHIQVDKVTFPSTARASSSQPLPPTPPPSKK